MLAPGPLLLTAVLAAVASSTVGAAERVPLPDGGALRVERASAETDTELARRLAVRVSVRWNAVPVAAAADELARLSGLPLIVDGQLRHADAPSITVDLENVTAATALATIEHQAGLQPVTWRGARYLGRHPPPADQPGVVLTVEPAAAAIRPEFDGPALGHER